MEVPAKPASVNGNGHTHVTISAHTAPTHTSNDIKHEWGSRCVDIFEKIEQIGEGTYGQVYQAKNKQTGDIVALKKVRMDNEKEGFPITAIREIKILKELDHPNVVKLKEIVTSKAADFNKGTGSIYMVFEYLDHDLTGLMDSPAFRTFTQAQIKCYMQQLLEGLHYIHKNNVLHRDIKGSNLLLNNNGRLKLADFGLARPFNDQSGHYTNRVITLWYRPPELLLGATQYGTSVDMWSVGCILGELLLKKPLFPGQTESEQLEMIIKGCGAPSLDVWAGASDLPHYHMINPQLKSCKNRLADLFKDCPANAVDLIQKLLCWDPSKRISAGDALDHDYFWSEPAPCPLDQLPTYPSSHEYQSKKRRQQQQQYEIHKRPKDDRSMPGHYPPHGHHGYYHSNGGPAPYGHQYQHPHGGYPSGYRGSKPPPPPYGNRGYPPPHHAPQYPPHSSVPGGAPHPHSSSGGYPPHYSSHPGYHSSHQGSGSRPSHGPPHGRPPHHQAPPPHSYPSRHAPPPSHPSNEPSRTPTPPADA